MWNVTLLVGKEPSVLDGTDIFGLTCTHSTDSATKLLDEGLSSFPQGDMGILTIPSRGPCSWSFSPVDKRISSMRIQVSGRKRVYAPNSSSEYSAFLETRCSRRYLLLTHSAPGGLVRVGNVGEA